MRAGDVINCGRPMYAHFDAKEYRWIIRSIDTDGTIHCGDGFLVMGCMGAFKMCGSNNADAPPVGADVDPAEKCVSLVPGSYEPTISDAAVAMEETVLGCSIPGLEDACLKASVDKAMRTPMVNAPSQYESSSDESVSGMYCLSRCQCLLDTL